MPRSHALISSLVLTVVVCGCQRASAPLPAPVPAEEPCANVTGQLEMTACWGAAANQIDGALNEALAKADAAARETSDEAAAMLRQTQGLWERYRDAECALYRVRVEGGSAESMVGSVCRWRLATERLKEVRALIGQWQDVL